MKTMLPAVAAVLFLLAGCATAPRYQKMLVVGDSLTACAPLPALGWNHDWGLAATARENDFVHRLHGQLKKHSPALRLAVDSIMYQDEMTGWVHLIPCDADLVVIQLSENYQGGISLEEYRDAYAQMIDELREGSPKTIVCLGPWKNTQLEPVIAEAAKSVITMGPLAGLGIYNIGDDYYDAYINYKQTKHAIGLLNPANPK